MHKLLKQWDASLTPEQYARLDTNLSRRSFLQNGLKAAATLSLGGNILFLAACSHRHGQVQSDLTQVEPWYTFAVTQQHLFPDDGDGPDARSIHATRYLKFVLDAPDTDPEVRTFILRGVDWLNRLAISHYTAVFTGCTASEQHSLLHEISHSRAGERWMSYLLTYIFEALLSDPVYGGNTNEIGWQWLQYIPGFPRPPYNKRYVDLL